MNDLALFSGTATAIANIDDFDASINQGLAKAPDVKERAAFLKLNQKSGTFSFGKDSEEVEEGSLWAVASPTFMHGYQHWSDPKVTNKKSELIGEVYVPYNQNKPAIRELDDKTDEFGGEWKDAVKWQMACISGEAEGEQVVYGANSYGGCKAYKGLLTDIQGRPEKEYFIPVVVLETESYESNFGDTIYNPVFRVVDWATPEGVRLNGEAEEVEEEAESEEAPSRRRRNRS